MGKPCFSLIYQLLCQFLCHLLSQCLKEPVFLPERKFTALIPAKPSLCRFADITAAGGTGTNDLAFRLHQHIGTFYSLVGFNKSADHAADFAHKGIAVILAVFYFQQFFLPVCRHGWGLNLFRHHRHQRISLIRRAKEFRFPITPALDKAFLHQFFDDGSACSRCADAFSLYTGREFIRAGTLHR